MIDDDRRHERLPDPEWRVLESETEYDTGWFTGGYDLIRQPNGTTKCYFWAELATAVVVVVVTDDHVVLVRQYRPNIRQTQFELPADVVEKGESFADAGVRKLREEAGFAADSASVIGGVWCSTGVLRHRRGFVFAEGLTSVERDLDDNGFLSVHAVLVEEAIEWATEPPTNDTTVEGVLFVRDEGLLWMVGEISPVAVEELLDGEDLPLVVDVSTEAEFALGHMPGSINVPLLNLVSHLDRVAGVERIVTVCLRGEASVQAVRLLSAYEGTEDARIQGTAGELTA